MYSVRGLHVIYSVRGLHVIYSVRGVTSFIYSHVIVTYHVFFL